MLVRTTLRLKEGLKSAAEFKALEENITLQELFNRALAQYLKNKAKKEGKKISFKSVHLGAPLDNLTRDNFYSDSE